MRFRKPLNLASALRFLYGFQAKPEDMQPRELFDPSVANPMLVLPLIAG